MKKHMTAKANAHAATQAAFDRRLAEYDEYVRAAEAVNASDIPLATKRWPTRAHSSDEMLAAVCRRHFVDPSNCLGSLFYPARVERILRRWRFAPDSVGRSGAFRSLIPPA